MRLGSQGSVCALHHLRARALCGVLCLAGTDSAGLWRGFFILILILIQRKTRILAGFGAGGEAIGLLCGWGLLCIDRLFFLSFFV